MTATPSANPEELLEKAIQTRDAAILEDALNTLKDKDPKIISNILQNNIWAWDKDELLNNQSNLNTIIACIRIFRKHNIRVNLSAFPTVSLSKLMKQLFLLKPSDAHWVLNMNPHLRPIEFSFNILDYHKTEVHVFNPEEGEAMFHCLKNKITLSCTPLILNDLLICNYAQADSKHYLALASHLKLKTFYKHMYIFNSQNCFGQFLNEFQEVMNPEKALKELKAAINARASKLINVLLARTENNLQIVDTELEQLIQETAMKGDLVILLALCRNDFQKAAGHLFNDQLFSEKNQITLYNHLITLLRFSSIDDVEQIIKTYNDSCKNNDNLIMLKKTYELAKQEFFNYAPAFSRYTNLLSLTNVKNDIRANTETTMLIEAAEQDMQYGKERSELTSQFVEMMKASIGKNNLLPTRPELLTLPTSSSGSRVFAAILEKIADYNAKKDFETSVYQQSPFYQLRTSGYSTPVGGQYVWAKPLISTVFYHSQSKHIIRSPNQENNKIYSLTYDQSIITTISTTLQEYLMWHHGRLPLASTIQDIENLLELMQQPLPNDPGSTATPIEIKHYQDSLTLFYAQATQLVWLIGNTQPLDRGSGSAAELTLKAIFEFHGLQAPILKPEFPQLDVLDITFPLDDYIKLFPYFCEPSSLPEHLRKSSLSHLSANEQLIAFYKEINHAVEQKVMEEPNSAPAPKAPAIRRP